MKTANVYMARKIMGRPGVFFSNLYLCLWKPVPTPTGTGFHGYRSMGYAFIQTLRQWIEACILMLNENNYVLQHHYSKEWRLWLLPSQIEQAWGSRNWCMYAYMYVCAYVRGSWTRCVLVTSLMGGGGGGGGDGNDARDEPKEYGRSINPAQRFEINALIV